MTDCETCLYQNTITHNNWLQDMPVAALNALRNNNQLNFHDLSVLSDVGVKGYIRAGRVMELTYERGEDYRILTAAASGDLSPVQLKQCVEKILGFPLSNEFFEQVEDNAKRKYELQRRLGGKDNNACYMMIAVDMVKQIAMEDLTKYHCKELLQTKEV